jgi:hypothetical protein
MVVKDACSSRLVSLADRPCKLHFRKDTVFPLPCLFLVLPKSSYPPEFLLRSSGAKTLPKPRLPLPIILLFKPLVETPRLTLLSLLVVVSKIHSFEEGNCGRQKASVG